MRQRLKGIPFNKVTEDDLTREFFEHSDNPLEKTIEQTYVAKTCHATGDFVKMKAYGTDDGIVRFCYGKYRDIIFEMLAEIKRNVAGTTGVLLSSLTQALCGHWRQCIRPVSPPKYNRKGFIIKSSKFFSYIYLDGLTNLLNALIPLFESINCCPSAAWKQPEIKKVVKEFFINGEINFNLYKYNAGMNFCLDEVYKQIYLECLD